LASGQKAIPFLTINNECDMWQSRHMQCKIEKQAETVQAGATGESAEKSLARREYIGLLTVPEILPLLKISRRTLNSRIADGSVPAIKLGKRLLFDWDSVRQSLIRRQRQQEAA
jgi:hypothetical protein